MSGDHYSWRELVEKGIERVVKKGVANCAVCRHFRVRALGFVECSMNPWATLEDGPLHQVASCTIRATKCEAYDPLLEGE